MTFPLTERRITLIGLILGLIVLVALATYAVDRRWEQTEQRETFREARNVVGQILSFQSYMSDAESGQRGFLLTRDPQYLGPYHAAVEKLPSVLTVLEQRIRQNSFQRQHMETLRVLTERKLAELRTTLDIDQNNPTEAIEFVRSNAGKRLMDDFKLTLRVLLDREYELLQIANQRERQAAEEAFHTIISATVLALILLGIGTYRVVRDSEAREQADRLMTQTQLLNLAPIMTRDLDGHILSWSQGYERLYGWTEEEAVGKLSHDLLKSRSNIPSDEIRIRLLREGQWSGELTHTRRDGTTIQVAANWTLLKEGRRRLATIVEVNTDISDLKAAQAAQARSEARFRLLADNMAQLAWIADEKGWIYWYNQRWFDYTGTTLSEVEGWGWKKVHHPDHVERIVKKLARCFETGETWEDTFPLRGRDGHYRWFVSGAIPIHDAQGRIIQWFGTSTDITDRYQAEQALKEQMAFTVSILNSLQPYIAVIDKRGIILCINESWNRVPKDIEDRLLSSAGMDIDYLEVVRTAAASDETARRIFEGIEAVLAESLPTFETTYSCHFPSTQRWFHMTVVPLQTESGGAVIALLDITSRKEAENSRAFLASIVSTSPDAIISKSIDGHIRTWNRGAEVLFGFAGEELIGQSIDRLVPEGLRAEELRLRGRILHGDVVEQFETQRLHRSGRLIDISVSMSPIVDETGAIIAIAQIMRDISIRKHAEKALERVNSMLESKSAALAAANKELEAFSYSVSHDLRAPLRTMTGFAQALLEDYGDKLEPEASRYLTIISNGARQMGRLIDDLLSFSRLSRQALSASPISIAELVQEIREELAADQSDRTVEWDVADLPMCRGDRTTIKMVLANLLGNALKYTRPRDITKIQLGWQVDEQQPTFCQIFVKDNGVGFDMRYADKLFTVFQRLHRAEEFEGTGVGLAIVQRIVHRHGGRVWAAARPNEGATFWFTLERSL
jgi:PAS domain S-box-containing protein